MNKTTISIENFHIPRWNELPNVDLYLDQVVNLINNTLSPYLFFKNDSKKDNSQLLTKTMINNYVKNFLIQPPVKKLYSKPQLARLFVICVLKQVYSMQSISELINLFLKDKQDVSELYNHFCSLFEETLSCTYNQKDFVYKNQDCENFYLLKSILLSCSFKIYVQNTTLNNNN